MAVREIRAGLLVLSVVVSAACASSGGSSSGSVSPEAAPAVASETKPQMKSPNFHNLTISSRFSGTIDLPIDEKGRPDILRMRVMGTMTEDMRREISSWLSQSTYEPATRGGVPVPGVLNIKFRMR